VLIVSGSQQGLDLLAKVLIDPGSTVLVENPTYLGALQSFSMCQPRFVAVPTDEFGIIPEALDHGLVGDARLLYVLPNFQNPTGRTLDRGRRERLVTQAAQQRLLLVEDDPYGELRYGGNAEPSLLSLAGECGATVVRLGTFSKVLAPGLRLGYLVAPPALRAKLVQAKQATDLHSATLTQMAVFELIKDGFLDRHLPGLRKLYADRCQTMLDAMATHFPANAHWQRPQGGMFIWVTLREGADSIALLEQALSADVAFVPGVPFYATAPQRNTLRLSFVTVPEEKIREGIARLGATMARC